MQLSDKNEYMGDARYKCNSVRISDKDTDSLRIREVRGEGNVERREKV